MKKILLSLLGLILAISLVGLGAFAFFSDVETSTGNTFTAGTLDLNIDGSNTNVVKFTVGNMRPGNQPKGSYTLANVGTINGFLDLENIVVTSAENGRLDPEIEAGDTTDGVGELQNVLGVYLFVDYGKDGWFSVGDKVIYNGLAKDMPTHFELNEPLAAGADVNIQAIINWWSTPNDNQAQSDSMTIDITFELAQTEGQ